MNGDDIFLYDANMYVQGITRIRPVTRWLSFSDRWQVLEEQHAGVTEDRYVWTGVGYVNDMVLRERQRFGEDALEGGEVTVAEEQVAAADAAVEHVKDHPARRVTGPTWHARQASGPAARASKCVRRENGS